MRERLCFPNWRRPEGRFFFVDKPASDSGPQAATEPGRQHAAHHAGPITVNLALAWAESSASPNSAAQRHTFGGKSELQSKSCLVLFEKPFDLITYEDLESLVANRIRESFTLEYKTLLKLGKAKGDEKQEADRWEFLADVCQFANARGGILVCGVAEERGSGEASALVPLESLEPAKGPDQLEGQILGAVKAGIEPQLYGVRVKVITVEAGHFVLVWVPKSAVGPHRVTYTNKFYIRGSQSKLEMDVSMLRKAFNAGQRAKESFREGIDERLKAFLSGSLTRARLFGPKQPCWILHIVSLHSLQDERVIDTAALRQIFEEKLLLPIYWRGSPYVSNLVNPYVQYDFEGVYTSWARQRVEGRTPNYVHLGREGLVEIAMMNGLYPDGNDDRAERWYFINEKCGGLAEDFFGERWWEEQVQPVGWLRAVSNVLEKLLLHPPFYLSLTLLKADKVTVNGQAAGRVHLQCPALFLEGPGLKPNELRQLFDMVMNAYGLDCAEWPN